MKFLENLDRQIATDRLATGWLLMSNAEAIAELVRAADRVLENRDAKTNGQEKHVTGDSIGSCDYWSPAATMIDSRPVNDLRQALRRLDGEQT